MIFAIAWVVNELSDGLSRVWLSRGILSGAVMLRDHQMVHTDDLVSLLLLPLIRPSVCWIWPV
ncbi:MAG: hypothetical protein CMD33_10465 [Flavobacteriales bacterium]|nr:hypothetical protein [Flavobacteriales bacterium]